MWSGSKKWVKGGSLYDYYLYEWAGVNPDNGNPQWYYYDNGEKKVTEDYSSLTSDDKVKSGSSLPDVTGGFSTDISWKGLTLSALFSYAIGGKLYNNDYTDLMGVGGLNGSSKSAELINRWTPENRNTNVPKIVDQQTSVKEVYDQALADLKESVKLIPEKYNRGVNTTDYYKINHTVAMGILARTALYARDWQTAYDYASKVLEKNPYLMTEAEYKSGFNNCNNGEWLWGYSATQDDSDGAYTMNFKDKSLDGYGSLCVDPYFVENYHDNDYRKDLFQDWGYTAQGGKVVRLLNSKFAFQDIDNGITDMDLMRTSEMYLIKAEAAYYLHHTDEAKSVLYTLQQARMKEGKTAPEITATGEDLLKAIWLERRLELWGEV
jgi:hypothetical protein